MSNDTRRILLVEDEKAIRDAVAAYLQRENYRWSLWLMVKRHLKNSRVTISIWSS